MRRLALLALALVLAAPVARAHVGSHEIAVREGFYDPPELRIDPGETVTWNALAQGHTITADDGRFDLPSGRLTRQGDRFQWAFPEDETFFFHCKVHGSMFGVIVVGEGTPPSPPSGEPPEIRRVPSQYPSISAAIRGASPGTVVEIAPRSYVESVRVDVPGLVLRGMGASPADVRIEGGSVRGIGIEVAASGVRIEQLTVRRTTFAGIFVDQVARTTLTDVLLDANDRYGIRLVGVRGAVLRRVHARSSSHAGISIAACDACDVMIDDALLERNLAGVAVVGGAGVVMRNSTARENGTGIALKTLLGQPGTTSGIHVYGNRIEDNTFLPGTRPPLNEELEIPTGAGVWVSGARHVVIEANEIDGHVYGIAIAGLTAPALAIRVTGNQIDASSAADLGWDGLGVGVCFTGNAHPDASEVTTDPPGAATLAACEQLVPLGIPYPVVGARLLAHGL